jgi:hypothetical protein
MRKDEKGYTCPSTLGEYRDLCDAVVADPGASSALSFLDKKIAEDTDGRDALVLADDLQMRSILMPMLQRDVHSGGMHPEAKQRCQKLGIYWAP